jgi:hypothetical protein
MQKITILRLFVLLITFSALQVRAQNLDNELEKIITPLTTSISNQTVKNVAIADFTLLDGTPTELGKYLAEEFTYALVSAPKKTFNLIDRSRVAALIKENGLGSSGLVDANTIAKLGKMKGIDAVIAGTLTSTGNTLRLIIKVWNLETQGIIAVGRGDISKTPMIIEMEGKVVSGGQSGTNTPTGSITPKSPPSASPIGKATVQDVTYELLECKQSGQTIRCQFQIKSESKDEDVSIWGLSYTQILDSATGREFDAETVTIAEKTGNGSSKGARKLLIAGYPVKATVDFGNVNIPITIISKLQLGTGRGPAVFRNVKMK